MWPMPSIKTSSAPAMAAAVAGIDYVTLVNRIADLAIERRQTPEAFRRKRAKPKRAAAKA